MFTQLLETHYNHLLFCILLLGLFYDFIQRGYTLQVMEDINEKVQDGQENVGGFNATENVSSACQDVSNQIETQDQIEEEEKDQNNNCNENENKIDEDTEGIEMNDDFNNFEQELFGSGTIDDEDVEDDIKGDIDDSHIMEEFDEKLWNDSELEDEENNNTIDSKMKNDKNIIENEMVANEDNEDLNEISNNFDKNNDDISIDKNEDDSINDNEELDESNENSYNFDDNEDKNDIESDENTKPSHVENEDQSNSDNENIKSLPTGISNYDDNDINDINDEEQNMFKLDNDSFKVQISQNKSTNSENVGNASNSLLSQSNVENIDIDMQNFDQSFSDSTKRSFQILDKDKQLADLKDEIEIPLKKSNIVESNDNDNQSQNQDLNKTNAVTHINKDEVYDSLAMDMDIDSAISKNKNDQSKNKDLKESIKSKIYQDDNIDENFEKINQKNDDIKKVMNLDIIKKENLYEYESEEKLMINKFDNLDSWYKSSKLIKTNLNNNLEILNDIKEEFNLKSNEDGILYEKWIEYLKSTEKYSYELCEKLRIIIEPTQASKLSGSFKTGKKLNMKKIITYLASNFTKDCIWMRRIKPTQRKYQIMLAIDDSTSMHDNKSKDMAFESLAMLSSAFNLLDIGEIGLCSYGEYVEQLISFNDKYLPKSINYANVVKKLTFLQNKTKVSNLLKHVIKQFEDNNLKIHKESNQKLFSQLLIILSDGRGIFSDGTKIVIDSIEKIISKGIFILFIILDNPHINKEPIDKINVPIFKQGMLPDIKSYMEIFPFPHYIVLREISLLPQILADAVRQWVEMVTIYN